MAIEEKQSPENSKRTPKGSDTSIRSGRNGEPIFSPRFRSVAAMAGWDEEALILASLVVEDTPERESKQKRRANLIFKTPPLSSRRKRRGVQRVNTSSVPTVVLNLDDDDQENSRQESSEKRKDVKFNATEEKKREEGNAVTSGPSVVSPSSSCAPALPCMDRLREELSCAICLEICFEPSTTPCGHSFCKKCLKSAADKCGKKCPKCRQLIGNGRSCTVNTVLWNTIQLLFPQEVEARNVVASASKNCEPKHLSPENRNRNSRTRSTRPSVVDSREFHVAAAAARRRRPLRPSQDEDAALALRLQREEFMEVFRGSHSEQLDTTSSNISYARANLRAMASRAINLRARGRPL